MITAEIDTSGLTVRLNELQAALIGQGQSGDMRVILKDEARFAVGTLIRDTPPQTLNQGRTAVRRDLGKLFRAPIGKSKMMAPGGDLMARAEEYTSEGPMALFNRADAGGRRKRPIDYLLEYMQAGNVAAIGNMFKRMGILGEPRNMTLLDMAAHHRSHRHSRGRVGRVPRTGILMPLRGLGKYIALTMKRVGRMKAGWAPAMLSLGGKLPSWVRNHATTNPPGYVIDQMASANNPSITVANNADGININVGKRVRGVLRERERAIRLKIELVVSGYARDVANGI
mgnify:FL=1